VCLTGTSSVVDDVSMLGLDRFDANGHSRLAADPIALPFPEKAL
jgi:sarcosine oxidase, subunit beta